MFVIKNMLDPIGKEKYVVNDIKEIGDIITGLIGDEAEASEAMKTASDMGFGGLYECFNYRLECVRKIKDSISF